MHLVWREMGCLLNSLFFCVVVFYFMGPALGTRGEFWLPLKREFSWSSEDLVTNLPGQPMVGFEHYAGYVTVNEENGRALFYWFFEASHPEQKPLVLWLNGGPGCSSVGYGATQEIGPFFVDSNGLKLNPFAWNGVANILFLESPVGVGFSYSNITSDYKLLGDDFTALSLSLSLSLSLYLFSSLTINNAGKYVPELAELIHDKNKDPSMCIDLKGFMVGNPETSDGHDWEGLVDYAWSHAVVSDETHQIIKDNCDFHSNDTWSNERCNGGVDEVLKQYGEIDIYSLYTSRCIPNASHSQDRCMFSMSSSTKMLPRVLGGYDPCLDDYATAFYNRADVQRALHVTDGNHLRNWTICNEEIFNGWADSKPSVLSIYKKLIAAGLRIWVYSGDTDGRVPVLSTRYSLNALGIPTLSPWRPWYHGKQVSGWVQEYDGLTFATFKGAGHAVPVFKPNSSLAFFKSFLFGESLPSERYKS
ncbi:serine carboxypeptidase-like 31 [Amborella trichopoda]|uniref:serine carboxypeptidase-like 31 n=1 Tax=Amborella trichopoda TaxID=13333 RepID=UPI0009BCC6C1|nr:serine carboxypeptidase-like 31 [Amborella trichopoda]|eukprot:XP_020521055.1 serine carboxypeptidase-like 31 [Amborella trichopoda]